MKQDASNHQSLNFKYQPPQQLIAVTTKPDHRQVLTICGQQIQEIYYPELF